MEEEEYCMWFVSARCCGKYMLAIPEDKTVGCEFCKLVGWDVKDWQSLESCPKEVEDNPLGRCR